MTRDDTLEVCWSAAAERAGLVPGLSSPLIGSTAQLCIQQGHHPNAEGPRQCDVRPVRACRICRQPFRQLAYASRHRCLNCLPTIHGR